MSDKYLSLLGLAQKAGQVVAGDMAVRRALARDKVKLLLIAGDASENSKKEFRHLADRAHVAYAECATTAAVGARRGRGSRAAVAILERGFATAVRRALLPDTP